MTEENKPEWQVFDPNNALNDRPPLEWVIQDLIVEAGVSIFYGAPGTLKSMVTMDAMHCVAIGKPWLSGGSEPFQTMQAPVLWVDLDNGMRRTHDRVAAFIRAHGGNRATPFYYVSMPEPWLNMNDLESVLCLRDVINQKQARWCTIDSFVDISGGVDENSSQVSIIVQNLRRLANATNCHISVIHHARKGGANGGSVQEALRGSGSIAGKLDLGMMITRDNNTIIGLPGKERDYTVPKLNAEFNYEHKPGTREMERAWFSGIQHIRGDNPIRESILFVVGGHDGIVSSKLTNLVIDDLKRNGTEAPRARVRAWLDDMANVTGELIIEKGPYNANIIKLAEQNVPGF